MNIRNIKIICVGKVKTSYWKEACDFYINRLKHFANLQHVIVKDADLDNISEKIEKESQAILKHIQKNDYIICLDENGKSLASTNLAEKLDEQALTKDLCFIIGGAYGVSQEILQKADFLLSFGKQTFPHELAHVLLCEQIFRSCSILKKTGYHHENPLKN